MTTVYKGRFLQYFEAFLSIELLSLLPQLLSLID